MLLVRDIKQAAREERLCRPGFDIRLVTHEHARTPQEEEGNRPATNVWRLCSAYRRDVEALVSARLSLHSVNKLPCLRLVEGLTIIAVSISGQPIAWPIAQLERSLEIDSRFGIADRGAEIHHAQAHAMEANLTARYSMQSQPVKPPSGCSLAAFFGDVTLVSGNYAGQPQPCRISNSPAPLHVADSSASYWLVAHAGPEKMISI